MVRRAPESFEEESGVAKTAKFLTKHGALRLWRTPPVTAYNALGQPQGMTQVGVFYQFAELGQGMGVLEVKEGQDLVADGPLEDGQPTMQDAISWIRAHPDYNNTQIVGGFVEDGREPGRVPEPRDELAAITAAVVALDGDAIQAVLDAERAGHDRGLVLAAAEVALDQVADAVKAIEESQAASDAAEAAAEAAGTLERPDDGGTAENSVKKAPAKK